MLAMSLLGTGHKNMSVFTDWLQTGNSLPSRIRASILALDQLQNTWALNIQFLIPVQPKIMAHVPLLILPHIKPIKYVSTSDI